MKKSIYFIPFLFSFLFAEKVDFNQQIRPILSDRCFHCHGPDEHDRKGKLRLDMAEGPDGAYRERKGSIGIKPGDLEKSEVWYRIITDDEDDVMPPLDSHKKALTPSEKNLVKQWILEGAQYQKFWAFVPPKNEAPPITKDKAWSKRSIDQFVLAKMEERELSPSPKADKRSLIRRLSFDLTGLPPTLDEIDAYLKDNSPKAYEKLVDHYMNKPQYGEHMARYWLDLVRFADTNGIHHDHYRDLTPYRDWVIRSFNNNLTYDEFVKQQLAGDLYKNPSKDQLVASGFNRLHMIIDGGTMLPEESYTKNVIDRVTAVGTAFMGLTVQCAVCHDHKYDPITQKEFFGLFAFFNNIDARPSTGGRSGDNFFLGLQEPYISMGTEEQNQKVKEFEQKIHQSNNSIKQLKKDLKPYQNKKEMSEEEKTQKSKLSSDLKKAEQNKKQLEKQKLEYRKAIPYAMVMKERKDIRPSYILKRGVYDNYGDKVERHTPAFLPPLKNQGPIKTRMDLANWFMQRDNPLTARVTVNRFWQQLFGTGLVKTSEDLGAQGEVPSHPKLLDHLVLSFIDSGWDIKALMKKMVMSKTYQQASNMNAHQLNLDPENRLLARGSRFRMDAEMIRDQILASSGLLNPAMYGKSVKPPQPAGIWKAVTMPYSYPKVYQADTGDKIYRRSVYTFWKRGMAPPQMTIFNAPTREACTARRERTNTPLQALLLLNEKEYMKAARHLASRLMENKEINDRERLSQIYETITSRELDETELKNLLQLKKDLENMYAKDFDSAKALTEGTVLKSDNQIIQLASWTIIANTIYNLDITKTRG
jgi:hypothetical protein